MCRPHSERSSGLRHLESACYFLNQVPLGSRHRLTMCRASSPDKMRNFKTLGLGASFADADTFHSTDWRKAGTLPIGGPHCRARTAYDGWHSRHSGRNNQNFRVLRNFKVTRFVLHSGRGPENPESQGPKRPQVWSNCIFPKIATVWCFKIG